MDKDRLLRKFKELLDEFYDGSETPPDIDLNYFTEIPAGTFLYGDEKREVYLQTFYIGRCCVTEGEFAKWKKIEPRSYEHLPAVNLTFQEAGDYAKSIGCRLPTNKEWEKAARGTDGREYPWGNEFDALKCNCENRINRLTTVRSFPSGVSPYGCYNMVGNAWEYVTNNNRCPSLRGGSFALQRSVRCAYRLGYNPSNWYRYVGFRVVLAPENPPPLFS